MHSSGQETYHVPADGRIICDDFPLVIMTTNGEREFSPAFKRRCLTITMDRPKEDKLKNILTAYEQDLSHKDAQSQLEDFLAKLESQNQMAVDQLLNAVYLTSSNADVNPEQNPVIKEAVLKSLSQN